MVPKGLQLFIILILLRVELGVSPCTNKPRATELDITLLGLQSAGKTSLLRVLVGDEFSPDSIPTVGFAMKRISLGSVTLKCWDLGGQPRFRSMWERYCRGVDAIIFVVDSADPEKFELAKKELFALMEKDTTNGIPLLVLGNKNDLAGAADVDQIISAMGLKSLKESPVSCYSISVKEANNLNSVLNWLISRKKNKTSASPSSA